MENKIAIVISHYEEEKARLQILIKECMENLEGPDYLLASYHQKALYQLQHKLRILHNFDDDLFDEKERALKSISFLEKMAEKDKTQYLEQHLQMARANLAKLIATPKATLAHQEENILDKALVDLVNKKVKHFKLILDNSQLFFLQFNSYGNTVKVILPNIKKHIKKDILNESQIILFQKNGFEITTKNKLVRCFHNNGEETIILIKFLLVDIVFKIFYYKSFAKESFIEF